MKCNFRQAIPAALMLLVCLLASPAAAQERSPLTAPTIAASVAAAADWASTYHALKYYRVRETNPLLQPWQNSPGTLVSVGAMIDIGGVSAWDILMGRSHPRLASAGLWGMTVFRAYLAVHNLHNERIAAHR